MIPWIESPIFHNEIKSREISAQHREWAEKYHDDGYLVVEEDVLGGIDVDSITEFMVSRGNSRVLDGWKTNSEIRKLASNQYVIDLLRVLYGRDPVPFQTLNFIEGTQQPAHSDTIHFNTMPRKWMCGVWVALEDIGEDQGPLVVYRKSHKLPEYDYYDLGIAQEECPYGKYEQIMESFATGFEAVRVPIRKGHFLIWASNVLHGGSKIIQAGSTRHSQVTHFFFEDVIPYTPMWSKAMVGEFFVRAYTANISTLKPMRMTYNGMRVFPDKMSNDLFRLRFDEEGHRQAYLARYNDVKAAGDDPFIHYVNHGHKEGRWW